jgi:type I restriction enzyme S subunit
MNTYPTSQLAAVLSRSQDPVQISPEESYKQVTVRLFHKGVVLRCQQQGGAISTARQWRIRTGQVLLSRIDARNGAIGLVPAELDGAIVTNDFWAFDVNSKLAEPRFLDLYFGTPQFVEDCQRASEGTTNRVRVQPDRFLQIEVPLPALPEQCRIVARIEELSAKIEEAYALHRKAVEEANALLVSQLGQVFSHLEERHKPRKFSSFSPHVTSGPRNWAKHYEQDGYRFYRAQDIGPAGKVLDYSKVFITPPPGEQGRSAMLQSGDLMLVITGATVGRVSVYHKELEPGFVSQHVGICRLPQDEVEPEFASWGLRGPGGQAQLLGQRYGQGKPGLNLSNIRSLSLPFPALPEQRRIAAYLDDLQAKVDSLKKLQLESESELNALMPSILSRAFAGELKYG